MWKHWWWVAGVGVRDLMSSDRGQCSAPGKKKPRLNQAPVEVMEGFQIFFFFKLFIFIFGLVLFTTARSGC